jgi:hypothetical protein
MHFVIDDGGRAAAGYKGKAGDCVARAVAIATQQPYADVYAALADCHARTRGRKASGTRSARNGIHTSRVPFKRYMQSLGWKWTPTMGIGTGCKVHLADGELPMGRLIVSVSRHYTAVIDGVIHDTHDPQRAPETTFWYGVDGKTRATSGGRCVYGYWSQA